MLEDIEGGGRLRLNVDSTLLARYVQQFDEHLTECQRYATTHGVKLCVLDAESELDQAVLTLARKGTLVQ